MATRDKLNPLSRRSFIARSVGGGLFMGLGAVLPGCSSEEAAESVSATGDPSKVFSPAVWFELDAGGNVLVNIAKAEMGQHVGTALARIVADELGADWNKVSIEHVDSDPKWGYMVTGGSWSVFTSFAMLSQAGAAGRQVLLEAAAALLDVDPADCSASGGRVTAGSESLAFGDIVARGDVSRTFSDEELGEIEIKAPADRDLIGKPVRALDVPAKSSGKAEYGLDAELPGMVYAQPLIPPTRYGSVVRSVDDSAARDIPGYRQTLEIDDPSGWAQGWALVIADSIGAAMKAAKAVSVEWDAGPTAGVSEDDIFARGAELAADAAGGFLVVNEGDIDAALDGSDGTLESTYRTGSVLHFTLEPQNALVEFDDDGKCHIHCGNQWQSLILPYLAEALGMPESDIILHQYYLGGGFGRRLFGDQMIPAALAARELGVPVKLVLQREEDSRYDCVRSPSVCTLKAGFDHDGNLMGIDHAVVAGWPTLAMAPGFLADGVDGNGKFDTFSVSGADHWYTLPNHRVRAINNDLAQDTFLPGWLRAVGPGWTSWGVESFMDEIANELGEDPIDFRMARLNGDGKNGGSAPNSVGGATRLQAVLEDVRERSGWGGELPENEGMGVAVAHGQERNMPTWTACVAHVAVDPDSREITVKKLWQTIDCGTVVDPDGAMAQAEGGTLWGLSLALHEGTKFENGQVKDRNLNSYTPLRMADVPELDLKFMESTEFPTGMGEPPLIAVAPAIGNAVFAAIGIRPKDLPIRI